MKRTGKIAAAFITALTAAASITACSADYSHIDGYSDIEILRYYYGSSAYINTAEEISGIPASYPGYELTIGSSGEKVRQLQEQLNTIANTYTNIPKVAVDGIYGEATQEAVRQFQKIFNLPQTGVVDYPTWYRISAIYVALTKIAELQ